METPELRQYYGKLGSIDFLTDRPMAVAEVAGNRFRYLFANEEYRNTIRAAGMESLRQTEVFVNALAGPISKNIHSFLHDVIHTSSEKTLTYTVNGRYMRLEASYLASHDKHHLLLLYLTNFTIQEDQNASDSLDWVNRNLLYLYQNVSLVDMENDTAVPLVMNSPYRKYFYQKRTGIQDMLRQYARTMIHSEDQERFLAFNELDSMMGRIRKSPEGMISGAFRTLGNDGEYHWDIHSIFPAIRKGKVYLLYTARHFPKANA